MLKTIFAGLALGIGGYLVWRWVSPASAVTTGDDEGGLYGAVMGDFVDVSNIVLGGGTMNISLNGIAHIKKWEGFRANRYLDEAGKPTIGYGHLLKIWETYDTVSQAKAEQLLLDDLNSAEATVNRLVKVQLTQGQYDALVSFVFNVGSGNFAESTLLKMVNAGNFAGAKQQFGRWVYITKNGVKVVSNGLVNRRLADAGIFAGGQA